MDRLNGALTYIFWRLLTSLVFREIEFNNVLIAPDERMKMVRSL